MSTITPAPVQPVRGAFDTTPDYSGTFIPTLWSARLNAKFYLATIFGEIANTDWEGDIKNLGDKVIINNIPTLTIRDYQGPVGGNVDPSVVNALNYEVPVPDTFELPIDKAKYFAFEVSDVLEYQAKPDLMNMFTDDAAEQMKISIDKDVIDGTFENGDAANKGATAGAISGAYNFGTDTAPIALTSANIIDKITEMSSALDEQNVPETGRWLVIDPRTRQLMMESNLAQAQFMGDQTSMVRNGRIGMIDRFMVYVSNQLPQALAGEDYQGGVSGGTAARRSLMAGHKTAITFASQMSKVERLQNPYDFGEFTRGLNIYGYTVAKPESLIQFQVANS